MEQIYRIHIGGRLADHWAERLGNFYLERQEDGTTVLTGEIVDQSALHGVIACIRDFGLPLLSVSRVVGAGADSRSTDRAVESFPTNRDRR